MATDIKDLAIAYWRIERWLNNTNVERKMAASNALRNIKKYLDSHNVEVLDLVGQPFDSGLAVDVINNDMPNGTDEGALITETLKPIIMQDGAVIQFGQVSIGLEVKKVAENNAVADKNSNEPSQDTKAIISELEKLSEYIEKNSKPRWGLISVVSLLVVAILVNICLLVAFKNESSSNYKLLEALTNENKTSIGVISDSQKNILDLLNTPAEDNKEENEDSSVVNFKKYVIKSGDTLEKICTENGISYSENIGYIKSINGIEDVNKIYVGQAIILPIESEEEN